MATSEWESGEGRVRKFLRCPWQPGFTHTQPARKEKNVFRVPWEKMWGPGGGGQSPVPVSIHSRVEKATCPAEESILLSPKRSMSLSIHFPKRCQFVSTGVRRVRSCWRPPGMTNK